MVPPIGWHHFFAAQGRRGSCELHPRTRMGDSGPFVRTVVCKYGRMDQARELITDEVLDAFRRDGAVLLPGVFETWVETLRAGVERSIAAPGPAFDTYSLDEAPGRFYGDYSNWRGIPEY